MDSSGDRDRDDRLPRVNDMRGLLKFCMENTKSEDAPENTARTPMDEETKKWLEEALQSAKDNDPVKIINELTHLILYNPLSDEEKEAALEELNILVEHIDMSNVFYKSGGFKMVEELFKNPQAEIRWKTAELFATCVQNNPISQEGALEMGFVPILLSLVDTDEHQQVKIKAFYALSCLIRENPQCSEIISKFDGFSVLVRAMQSDIDKLQLKVAFMLQAMCENEPKCKDILFNLGMVEQLVGLLHSEHSSTHEYFMMSLLMLVKDNPKAIKECFREELQVKEMISSKLRMLQGKEEYQEELDYCSQLMKILYSKKDNNIDR